MNFGEALDSLKEGKKVSRLGWNGRNMFIYLVKGSEVQSIDLKHEALRHVAYTTDSPHAIVKISPHIDMKASDGSIVVGWLASQTDMLAEDWIVYA